MFLCLLETRRFPWLACELLGPRHPAARRICRAHERHVTKRRRPTANVTSKAATDVPTPKQYKFAMLEKKLVIVNPTDHKIVDVIVR